MSWCRSEINEVDNLAQNLLQNLKFVKKQGLKFIPATTSIYLGEISKLHIVQFPTE